MTEAVPVPMSHAPHPHHQMTRESPPHPVGSFKDPLFHVPETLLPLRMTKMYLNPDYPGGAGPIGAEGGALEGSVGVQIDVETVPAHLPKGTTRQLRQARRARRSRDLARFKTQPVTFDEILEVDEEAASATRSDTIGAGVGTGSSRGSAAGVTPEASATGTGSGTELAAGANPHPASPVKSPVLDLKAHFTEFSKTVGNRLHKRQASIGKGASKTDSDDTPSDPSVTNEGAKSRTEPASKSAASDTGAVELTGKQAGATGTSMTKEKDVKPSSTAPLTVDATSII